MYLRNRSIKVGDQGMGIFIFEISGRTRHLILNGGMGLNLGTFLIFIKNTFLHTKGDQKHFRSNWYMHWLISVENVLDQKSQVSLVLTLSLCLVHVIAVVSLYFNARQSWQFLSFWQWPSLPLYSYQLVSIELSMVGYTVFSERCSDSCKKDHMVTHPHSNNY